MVSSKICLINFPITLQVQYRLLIVVFSTKDVLAGHFYDPVLWHMHL